MSESEEIEWEQPGDPDWVPTYLKAIRAGKTEKYASMFAGVTPSGTRKWRKRDSCNSRRHTRAKEEARARVTAWLDDVLKNQAERGSTWHLARRMALLAPTTWKKLNKKLREAEPDTGRKDITSGGILERLKEIEDDEEINEESNKK